MENDRVYGHTSRENTDSFTMSHGAPSALCPGSKGQRPGIQFNPGLRRRERVCFALDYTISSPAGHPVTHWSSFQPLCTTPGAQGHTTLKRPRCQLQQPSLLIGSHLGQLPTPTPSHPGGRRLGTWPIGSQGRREDTAEQLQKRENTTALASAGRPTKASAARVKRVVLQEPLLSPRLTTPYT